MSVSEWYDSQVRAAGGAKPRLEDPRLQLAFDLELEDQVAGQTPQTKDHYTLCRCGGSKNKPFCDGTHWDGFVDEKN